MKNIPKTIQKSKTAVLLILLLLSNSSLALEIATHDNHQHGEHQQMHDMSEVLPIGLDFLESSHNTDDCLCDDICCVSSVGFSTVVYTCVQFGLFDKNADSCNLYQSVNLDLLLPPPTR